MERKFSLLEAKFKLEALCAYQERCEFELRKKMQSWRIPYDEQDRLIADLIVNNFLSEERFAEAFISGKIRIKRWGKIKIRQELKQRHISDYSINKGFKEISEEEYWENLLHLTKKKWTSLSKERESYQKKAKVYRFLQSKGYETDLIKMAVEEVVSVDEK